MANIQYADPFGGYVRGQQEGTQNAIQTGMAARDFRDRDLNYDFMKWYVPHRQNEAIQAEQQRQLGLNEGLQQNAARLSAYGQPGFNYLSDTLNNMYPGYNIGNGIAGSALAIQRAAAQGSGLVPANTYDPMFATTGDRYNQKVESLTPEQYAQTMSLRFGPNWQQQQNQASSQGNQFNAYDRATQDLFGSNNTAASNNSQIRQPPVNNSGGVQAYGIPNNPMPGLGGSQGGGMQTPSIWHDERANPTGGF
jgi:hypothetical protein